MQIPTKLFRQSILFTSMTALLVLSAPAPAEVEDVIGTASTESAVILIPDIYSEPDSRHLDPSWSSGQLMTYRSDHESTDSRFEDNAADGSANFRFVILSGGIS